MTIRVLICVATNGPTISFSICESRDSCPTSGFVLRSFSSSSRNCGYRWASWNASVGRMSRPLLLSSNSREQKKLAPRVPSAKQISANVWAIADFPDPTKPLSQNTRGACLSSNHSSSCRRTSRLVPFMHPCLSPKLCPASTVWPILFRRVRFASPYSQVTMVVGHRGSKAHNESAVLVVYIFSQRRLMQTLGVMGAGAPRASPIIHRGLTDVPNPAGQRDGILESLVQFPR